MNKVLIKCSYCSKKFQRERGRYNEAIKKHWNQYCSKECQNKSQFRRVEKICGNPECNNVVSRLLDQFQKSKSGHVFCSGSCAASFNNSKFPKRKPIKKKCFYCGKKFTGKRKYCSVECRRKARIIISKEEILKQIKEFYKTNKRIPLKRESRYYYVARFRFGTWNNAVKAAGFDPNPVRFAKKQIANDGHKCDSFAERIIDDWLYARNVPHEINVPYGKNQMTADFKINNVLIEFLGLQGELKEYDKSLKKKEKLWKQKRLKVIKIYPKDLFPKNKLGTVLNFLL